MIIMKRENSDESLFPMFRITELFRSIDIQPTGHLASNLSTFTPFIEALP